MNEQRPRMSDEVRETIREDMEPVRPLEPCWKRLLYILPVAVLALAMPFFYYELRDTGELGLLIGWIPVAIQILLAFALLSFALREGVPGWRGSSRAIFALCIGAFALQILVNLLIFLRSPAGGEPASVSMWLECFRVESLIGLPILVAVAWLVSRSLPQRPLLAGFLAGIGAGFAGDASWGLLCPISEPSHVLLGHTGGILVLGLTGFLLGYLWSLYAQRNDVSAHS